ncbi:MAG: hypothetical protein CMP48_03865 [Rickettsiales bacterium]|nr:hypothetical protein [Rickettsiales bacterium]
MRLFRSSIFITLIGILFSCSDQQTDESSNAFFRLLDENQSGIEFTNTLTPDYDNNILEFNYFYNGGGVGLGDVNNDGLLDVFFSGNQVSCALYLNEGELKFRDVTSPAGLETSRWATGVSMIDINSDGLLDIYVCYSGLGEESVRKNSFFINQGINEAGEPSFVDMAEELGVADMGYSTQASFFDYDKDGDLDMYLLTAYHDKSNPNYPKNKENEGQSPSTDRLYQNQGLNQNGLPRFVNVSTKAGITYEGYGLGIAINDINDDGWEDTYVANDFIYDDLVYVNNGDGTFSEKASEYLRHQSRFSMGCDMADINNDALVDLMVLDMLPADNHRQKMMSTATSYEKFNMELRRGYQPQYSRNVLQLNNGELPDGSKEFSEVGYMAGVYKTDWSWSPLLVDFDNDGYRDLFITNGIPKDITNNDYIAYRDSHINPNADYDELKKDFLNQVKSLPDTYFANYMYQNKGENGAGITFTDVTTNWGFGDKKTCSNGAAYGDLDGDGDLDLVINNVNDRAFIYENKFGNSGNFLRVKLLGLVANAYGLGSKVEIIIDGQTQQQHQSLTRGFQSSQDPVIHFGVSGNQTVEQVKIKWLDGKVEVINNVPANQVLIVNHSNAVEPGEEEELAIEYLMSEVTQSFGIDFTHEENEFDEFKAEFLIPHLYSREGPGIAVGDLNGDGLEDFVIGGAMNNPTTLFIQNNSGEFQKQLMEGNEIREDMGLLLFDADGDSDLDLYIVSGGSEFQPNSPPYQDRLMINDGKGNFTWDQSALPRMFTSGSCIVAADYDQDGDFDLFVGGRAETGRYPIPVRSYLLRNEDGRFTDVSLEVNRELLSLGMVTSALWTDYDNDGDQDLMVAGEWMPITLFENINGQLVNTTETAGFANHIGWWNSLVAGDFDADGDMDYVAGNLGLNSRFSASESEPVEVYANDFDRNGSLDPLLTKYNQGESFPVAGRDELMSQMMIFTRKNFPNYTQYADIKVSDLFTQEDIERSYHARATHFASSYIENNGDGTFNITSLPLEAQVAPVFGLVAEDINGDGYLDVILSGNNYTSDYMSGRYDSGNGLVLLGNGQGEFDAIPSRESGFLASQDQRSMAVLNNSENEQLIVTLANSGSLKLHKVNETSALQSIPEDVNYALIHFEDNRIQKVEFNSGSGYLSQSSRALRVPVNASKIVLVKRDGTSEDLSLKLP